MNRLVNQHSSLIDMMNEIVILLDDWASDNENDSSEVVRTKTQLLAEVNKIMFRFAFSQSEIKH